MIDIGVYRRRLIRSTWIAAAMLLATAASAAALPEVSLQSSGGVLRLALVGDPGAGTSAVAKGIGVVTSTGRIDAMLVLGDNIYPCGVLTTTDSGWQMLDPLAALGIPMFAVLGNHDYCGKPEAEVSADGVYPQWHMPARQYAIRSNVADIAMIDTTPFATGKNRDAADAVTNTFASSTAPWRLAVGHHTIVSSGWHGLFPREQARRMRELLPVLRDSNVEIYICGHDHDMELIDGYPRFIISGASSDPIPMVNMHEDTEYPKSAHFREPKGFAVLEITKELIRVRFHRADGHALSDWIDVVRR